MSVVSSLGRSATAAYVSRAQQPVLHRALPKLARGASCSYHSHLRVSSARAAAAAVGRPSAALLCHRAQPPRVISRAPRLSVMASSSIQVKPTSTEAAAALAQLTATAAKEAIAERGAFTVAVAGGSLIKLLDGLKAEPGVEWDKWHVFWVDERCVPHSDPESNYGGAYNTLLKDVPIPAAQLYAIDESLCQSNAGAAVPSAAAYDAVLKGLPAEVLPVVDGLPKFDLLLLGFGPDGHICSLFPNHPLLKEMSPWILPITDSPKPPDERITFSLPVVNAAKQKCFVAVGEGKAEMSATILEGAPSDGSIPAALVKGNVVWVMDDAAASKLQQKP